MDLRGARSRDRGRRIPFARTQLGPVASRRMAGMARIPERLSHGVPVHDPRDFIDSHRVVPFPSKRLELCSVRRQDAAPHGRLKAGRSVQVLSVVLQREHDAA